jgi:hypothetical protein
MSVEYTFFVRHPPRFDSLIERADDHADDDGWWANELRSDADGTWTFGGMTLSVGRYAPRRGDPLENSPYRDEIRWVIDADGHHGGLYAEWQAMSEVICRRWKGVLYTSQTAALWSPDARDAEPMSREILAAMIDRAYDDEATARRLAAGSGRYFDGQMFDAHFKELLVERARAGAPLGPFGWAIPAKTFPVPELARAETRRAFAERGGLAAAIAGAWERRRLESDRKSRAEAPTRAARAARDASLIEQRRRAGELHAGVPDDVRALARTDRDKAASAYASRYGVTPEQARKVLDVNAPAERSAPRAKRKR